MADNMADNSPQTTDAAGNMANVPDSDSGIGSGSAMSTPCQSVSSSVSSTPSNSEMTTPVLSPAATEPNQTFSFPPGAFSGGAGLEHQGVSVTTGPEDQPQPSAKTAMDVDFSQSIRPSHSTATATATVCPPMDRQGFFPPPDPPSPDIQIFIRNFNGAVTTYQISPSATVTDLKKKLHDKMGIPPSQQRLVYQGKEFVDGTPLQSYGVQSLSEISLLGRLRGGCGYHMTTE